MTQQYEPGDEVVGDPPPFAAPTSVASGAEAINGVPGDGSSSDGKPGFADAVIEPMLAKDVDTITSSADVIAASASASNVDHHGLGAHSQMLKNSEQEVITHGSDQIDKKLSASEDIMVAAPIEPPLAEPEISAVTQNDEDAAAVISRTETGNGQIIPVVAQQDILKESEIAKEGQRPAPILASRVTFSEPFSNDSMGFIPETAKSMSAIQFGEKRLGSHEFRKANSHPDLIEPASEIFKDTARKRVGTSHNVSNPVVIPEYSKNAKVEPAIEAKKKSAVFLPPPIPSKFRPLKQRKKKMKDGYLVYKGHPSWSIVLAIQFGLKHTSELIMQQPHGEFDEADFDDRLIFHFEAVATSKPSMMDISEHTRWECHAPFVYKKLREKVAISEEEFLASTCAESKLRELQTPGKSGALFYITEDEQYFLKTISSTEEETLKALLPAYFNHLMAHPESLLTKFLVSFGMRTQNGRHIRLIVMSSVFSPSLYVDQKFDLKGSTRGRYASEKEKKRENVILKDLDLVDPIYYEPMALAKLIRLLEMDSQLLQENNIMDYSLLMGISEVLPEDESAYIEAFGEQEENAPWFIGYQHDQDGILRKYRISMGIIDILQPFSTRKRAEYGFKSVQFCAPETISVNPPSKYRDRFVQFFKEKFLPMDVTQLEASSQFALRKAHVEESFMSSSI